jgi:hypothetical protein
MVEGTRSAHQDEPRPGVCPMNIEPHHRPTLTINTHAVGSRQSAADLAPHSSFAHAATNDTTATRHPFMSVPYDTLGTVWKLSPPLNLHQTDES